MSLESNFLWMCNKSSDLIYDLNIARDLLISILSGNVQANKCTFLL